MWDAFADEYLAPIRPLERMKQRVIGSEVEPHPDRLFEECPMSYSQTRRGLAAIRPDLYQWVEVSA